MSSDKNVDVSTSISSDKTNEHLFKDLARFNGEINRMNVEELIVKLKCFGLDTEGNKEILKKRLKNNYRKLKLNSVNLCISNKLPPYYIIIDFEATCNAINLPSYQQEIIEFPAVLLCSETQEIVDTFHKYCKPKINPVLSDFCVELTGITQEKVDSAESFEEVFNSFVLWLQKHSLGKKIDFAVVTDASWDMTKFLFEQCQYCNIPFPKWARQWVNIKRTFSSFYKRRWLPLKYMLEYVGLEFEGRLHCGLDDARNIARLLIRMLRDGAIIHVNERIKTNFKNLKMQQGAKDQSGEDIILSDRCITKNNLYAEDNKPSVRAWYSVIENKGLLSTHEKVKKKSKKLETKLAAKFPTEEMNEIYQWVQHCPLSKNGRKKLQGHKTTKDTVR